MKSLVFISLAIALSCFCVGDFYSLSFKNISGETVSVSKYRNKSLLVVVLPSIKDSAVLDELDSLAVLHGAAITVIAVTPYEYQEGYSLTNVKNVYKRHIGQSVVLTEIMKTSRNILQHPFIKWLTRKEENVHFDIEVPEPGMKFLINGSGEEYGFFDKTVPLSSPKIWAAII